MSTPSRCWCGEGELASFSPDYLVCSGCGTLVAASMPGREIARVDDEDQDFYGRQYWFDYQERELGTPDITVRARIDLPERCVYWLRTVLRYRRPPARALDVGCGHGGFVMLLARAGFEATGLELSPWVVDFARKTFGVPVLRGSLEEQGLGPGSVDLVTMMDVLEHLPEPRTTLRAALAALGEDGILVIQTPAVPTDLSWEAMVAANHPFLPLMRERGHLYLFSQAGLRRLLADVGVTHLIFEPAYFAAYDMFAVASRHPLILAEPTAIAEALATTPDGRLVRALVDLDDRWCDLQVRYTEAERDRAARLAALHDHGARLMASEGERHVLRSELQHRRARIAALEADRSVHVSVISDRGARLAASEADRAARLAVIQEQGARLAASEADRAARLAVIQEQAARLGAVEAELADLRAQRDEVEADRAARLAVIQEQGARLGALEGELLGLREQLEMIAADRAVQLVAIEEQRRRLAASEEDGAARLRVIHDQADQLQSLAAESEALRAELAALRFRDVRVLVRQLMRRVHAGASALAGLLIRR